MISDIVTVRANKAFKKHPKLSCETRIGIVNEITAFFICQCHGLTNHEVGSQQFAAQVEDTIDGEAVNAQEGIADCDPWLEGDMMDPEEEKVYSEYKHL